MAGGGVRDQSSCIEVFGGGNMTRFLGDLVKIKSTFFFFFSLGWNELLIASFSHRSITVKDGILLATGLHVHRNSAHSAGVGAIFDR